MLFSNACINQFHLAIFLVSLFFAPKKNIYLDRSWNVSNCQILQATIWVRNILSFMKINRFIGASTTIWHNRQHSGLSIGSQINTQIYISITRSFQKFVTSPFKFISLLQKNVCFLQQIDVDQQGGKMSGFQSKLLTFIKQTSNFKKINSLISPASICQSKIFRKATEKGSFK